MVAAEPVPNSNTCASIFQRPTVELSIVLLGKLRVPVKVGLPASALASNKVLTCAWVYFNALIATLSDSLVGYVIFKVLAAT